VVTWPLPHPFQRRFVIDRLGLAMIKSVALPTMEIWNVLQNLKIGWFWVVHWLGVTQGHRQCYHSIECIWFPICLIETMRLSCTVFEIQRVICRYSPTLPYPTCIWCPCWGWPCLNFEKIFGIRKLESMWHCLCIAVLTQYWLVTDTHTQTHGHSIYRAQHSSSGKNSFISKQNDNSVAKKTHHTLNV